MMSTGETTPMSLPFLSTSKRMAISVLEWGKYFIKDHQVEMMTELFRGVCPT